MILMSIDQSLSCSGIHVWEGTEHKAFYLVKTPTKDEVILRIREIMIQLSALIVTHKVSMVVIESLPFGLNSSSVRPLAGLYYCIQNLCIEKGIKFRESNVTAVKKLATGSGKAKKEDMIAALLSDNPTLHQQILDRGIKKTTGLADLADGYFIGKLQLKKEENGV